MVILDGKEVADNVINYKIHRFIGMFRKPYKESIDYYTPGSAKYCDFRCTCGILVNRVDIKSLPLGVSIYNSNAEFAFNHWIKGCFDIPQYGTMDSSGEMDTEVTLEQLEKAIEGSERFLTVARAARRRLEMDEMAKYDCKKTDSVRQASMDLARILEAIIICQC